MITEKYNILYSTVYGSRLYGTNNDASDYDTKHIYLPSMNDMLIGKPLDIHNQETTDEKGIKTDVGYIPIQKFAYHFMKGQTYALELAFVANKTPNIGKFGNFVSELIADFRTKDSAIIKYVESMNHNFKNLSTKHTWLKLLFAEISKTKCETLGEFVQTPEYLAIANAYYPIISEAFTTTIADMNPSLPNNKKCIVIGGEKLSFELTVSQAIHPINRMLLAHNNAANSLITPKQWKSIMQAIRILNQALQLFEYGTMSIPTSLENQARLVAIRNGEVGIDELVNEMHEGFYRLRLLNDMCNFPVLNEELSAKFEDWLGDWLVRFYISRN